MAIGVTGFCGMFWLSVDMIDRRRMMWFQEEKTAVSDGVSAALYTSGESSTAASIGDSTEHGTAPPLKAVLGFVVQLDVQGAPATVLYTVLGRE